MMSELNSSRRTIETRSAEWARKAAAFLADHDVTPNQISLASIVFAVLGAAFLVSYRGPLGLIACAIAIQLRLLCNLLDGMVAVEEGKQSPLGPLYNEVPDRIADSIFIVALGYATNFPWVGWLGALAAMLTAYVRALGGSLGLRQDFRGPMAKRHRMAAMTAGCLLGAIEYAVLGSMHVLIATSFLIAFGSLATCVTRLSAMAIQLSRLRQDRP